MSSQTSVLSQVKFCHEKVSPSLNSKLQPEMVVPFLLFMYSCQIQPMESWVNIITNNIMNPSKQVFVNLQFYLHIELYSQFWIHTKACTINQLFLPFWECTTSTFQHFMEIDPSLNYHNISISWYEKKITSSYEYFCFISWFWLFPLD